MATLLPPLFIRFRKVLLLSIFLFLFTSPHFLSASSLDSDDDDEQPQLKQLPKKKTSSLSSSSSSEVAASSTKLSKSTISSPKKNQTAKPATKKTTTTNSAAIGDGLSSSSGSGKKNQTKLITTTTTKSSNSTKSTSPAKSKISSGGDSLLTTKKKLVNSTGADTAQLIKKKDKKQLNSTPTPTKAKTLQASDPSIKQSATSPKNKTTSKSPTTTTTVTTKSQTLTPNSDPKTNNNNKKKPITKAAGGGGGGKWRAPPSWIEPDEDDDDLVSEFRDLPSKFHQHLIPDLERISMTSRKYLNQANKEITKGFKPYVGNKYATTVASFVSFAFILIPLLLVSLVVNRIKAYFSLQKLLIFVQVYLAIYFAILSLSALATGLEPLRFFYATAGSTYFGLMLLQTLAYLLYLVLLLIYLALVFSPSTVGTVGGGMGPKMLGLAQALMGFAVGLHLYVAVFHRVLLHQPPKTNWKVHGIYAACFLVVSLLAGAERRKKAYLEEGGEEGKVN